MSNGALPAGGEAAAPLRAGEPGDAVPARGEWRFAAGVALAFVAVAGLATFHHEMWRDELQAWLIARDSPSPLAVLLDSRYEGHPPLWFLLLWPLAQLTRDPAAMQVLHVLIGGATALIIARAAPGPRWMRAAAALGYFPVYEYGSIARNYGAGLLGLVAFAALFPRRRSRPVLLGLVVALTALTSLPACVLALAASLILAVEAVAGPPEARRGATWAGLAVALAGVAASVAQMMPPPDSGFARGWNLVLDHRGVAQVLEAVTRALLPLPLPITAFWQSDLLGALPGFAALSWAVGGALVLLAALGLARRPLALLFHLAATLGLLTFFYVKTLGYLRHWGFLFVALGVALWIARSLPPVELAGRMGRAARACERGLTVAFAALLVAHLAASGIAVAGEVRYVFSGAQGTAALIRRAGLDTLPLVADRDIRAVGVVGFLDAPALYAHGGDFGTYIVWNTARYQRWNVWAKSAQLSMERRSPVVVVLDSDALAQVPPPPPLAPVLREVGCVQGEIVPDETFCAWVLDPARLDHVR